MPRTIWFLAALALLGGCAVVRPRLEYPANRSVTVALEDTREPQASWALAQLPEMGAFVSKWILVGLDEEPEVTVRYFDFPDTADAVGDFTQGHNYIRIDIARTHSEASYRAVLSHELVHWFIDAHSPTPERAVYHLCQFAYNERAPPLCHPSISAVRAIMSPRVPDWPVTTPTHEDLAYFDWGMGH